MRPIFWLQLKWLSNRYRANYSRNPVVDAGFAQLPGDPVDKFTQFISVTAVDRTAVDFGSF
jgi:hypothetical protein